jgi:predicted lipoprotein
VGSVVDLLFVSGALGGALLVAVTAALDGAEQATSPGAPGAAVDEAGPEPDRQARGDEDAG